MYRRAIALNGNSESRRALDDLPQADLFSPPILA